MNNKAHLRPKDFDSNGDIIPMACKEEKGDLISREALKKACSEMVRGSNNSDFIPCPTWNNAMELIDNASTVELDESVIQEVLNKRCMTAVANEYLTALHGNNGRPQGEWITIESGEDLLLDHHWYLIVHKDFRTPMKALYHSDCPHFTFFYEGGEGCSYLFENKIICYRELPDIPIEGGAEE